MTIITTCCCCMNTRTGTIVSGIYTTILAGIRLIMMLSALASAGDKAGGLISSYIIDLLLLIGLLIVSIILIYGAIKDNRILLVPWMVFMVIFIILTLITTIIIIVYASFSSWVTWSNIIWFVIFNTINIYCLLCVISQYQELKEGRGTADYHRQLAASRGRPVVVTTTTTPARVEKA
ncbi:uncharacterized protein LOC100378476 [Saccoglossus kowalevskii]|uniref:Lysosomal-associated transmembrane protein 4B-like n=1 Tax=Saccoglossus kowalevskii TaxID=10224 RepID=A0ABM0GTR3_SACKO|nr:PREDICTED: lysosomal-associated transmembrane protein 4B-like [Saccoglossus kowalevskii]